jgi:hypothetical protein
LGGHRPPLSDGILALTNATSAGLPPVSAPVTLPVPYEHTMVPPSGFGHVNVTVGAVTVKLPLPPLVAVTLAAVGRPVTVPLAEQPGGLVLVQLVNVSAVSLPATGVPEAPPALSVLPPTVEAAQDSRGLMNPPEVWSTALVPVLSLAVIVVPAGYGDGQGVVFDEQIRSAEAVEAPANATMAKTEIIATPSDLMNRM